MKKGDIAGYKYFNCEDVQEIRVCIRGKADGEIKIFLDEEKKLEAGSISVNTASESWQYNSIKVQIPNGIHPIFIEYTGENAIDFKEFAFL